VRPLPGQTPPYSLGIKAGGAIYVAGQLPTDEKGNLVQGDIAVQAKQVFDNLRVVLQQAGSSLDNAVTATVMLQNATDFPAGSDHRQQFKTAAGATIIRGSMVRAGALLEISDRGAERRQRKMILPPGWMSRQALLYAIQSGDVTAQRVSCRTARTIPRCRVTSPRRRRRTWGTPARSSRRPACPTAIWPPAASRSAT
jgi:2-iminobutanoate/2-iminopropanoate deaminase